MFKKQIVGFLTILLLLSGCNNSSSSSDTQVGDKRYRIVDVPFREHGYSNFGTQVINSQKAYDQFIANLSSQSGWNNQKEFLSSMAKANIDFASSNLILFRITEGSGSNVLSFSQPKYDGDNLKLEIKKYVPQMGTMDMAYYVVAYVVDKKTQTLHFDISMAENSLSTVEPSFISISNQLAHDTQCDATYKPVCALKQVQCITAPCDPIAETYMNECMMKLDTNVKFHFDGTCPSSADVVAQGCKTWHDGCNTCSVYETGLMACTEMYCTIPSATAHCISY